MKVAIQANPSRGKEILSLLESLGGRNTLLKGNGKSYTYYIDENNMILYDNAPKDYKVYTLEEFEKEFPFKIGDKVKHITSIGTIKEYCYINNEPAYKVKSMELGIVATIPAKILEPYKEMEKRNITLTLDKAKEWYKKGGELKEVALQAYSKEELTKVDLPKTWEEFYEQYDFKPILNDCLSAVNNNFSMRYVTKFEAFVKLQYLRDCWRQGWKPDWSDAKQAKCYICYYQGKFKISTLYETRCFLSFPTYEMAKEFLECFRDLIEKAGDLI